MSSSAELAAIRPKGGFKVIYADPPWKYRTRGRQVAEESRLPSYKTMATPEICAMPVKEIAASSCWLFIWTTWPHLEHAFQVMKAWGFEYSGNGFLWVKLRRRHAGELMTRRSFHMGTGFTTRKNTEPCLLARRGSPKRLRADIHELVVEPLREHSRKPDDIARRIVRYAPGPRVELFARQAQPGFVGWGDEMGKFGTT